MDEIVLRVSYLVFGLFLLFFFTYSFFLVYHLFEFSYNSRGARLLAGTYGVISFLLLAAVVFFVAL